jgi:tetratricopeptide (TPR) repeat protein
VKGENRKTRRREEFDSKPQIPSRLRVFLFLSLWACGGHNAVAPVHQNVVLPPANPVAVAKMVRAVEASKDPNGGRARAIGLLKDAIGVDPNLWEARYDLGVLLCASGDLAGAEEQLAAAYKIYPDAEEVAVALGEVRRRRGEHKNAADDLGDFVQAHPDALQARTLYVAALRESGQVDKAIEQAREVLLRKPSDPQALSELALCHLAKGEKDTATLLAKQALDASKPGDPRSAGAERATALIALANGDNLAAFDAFQKAAAADPGDTTARIDMGAVLLKAGAYAKAEEQYRAILAVSPDDTEASIGLAAALRGESDDQHPGRLVEARALLEKVLQADSHQTSALFNLGVLLADFQKKPQDAAPYFRRFLSDAPSDDPMRADAEKYLQNANTPAPSPPAPAPAAPPRPR